MALFEAALGRSEAQLLPVPIDLGAVRSRLRAVGAAAVASAGQGAAACGRGAPGAWARELSSLAEAASRRSGGGGGQAEVARVLSLAGADAVDGGAAAEGAGA